MKYNLVLRSLGARHNSDLNSQRASMCEDNTYVTTIHVISSGIVKLGKLVSAQKACK